MNQVNQTKKILAHLSGRIGPLPDPTVPVAPGPERLHFLIVFSGNPIGLGQVMEDLLAFRKQGCTLDLAFSANAEALMDTDHLIRQLAPDQVIQRDMGQLKKYTFDGVKAVLAPLVTHNTARKLLLGVQDGLIPNLLWQALWAGIPVYMDLESLLTYHGRGTQNASLLRLMKQTVNGLIEMGVVAARRPAEVLEFSAVRKDHPADQKTGSGEAAILNQRNVITERDVLAHANGQDAMHIPRSAIVTPLARDTAAAHGIMLIRK